MNQSNRIRNKALVKKINESYVFNNNVPARGLVINGKPAMTQIDPEKVGAYVLITVRDPLIVYSEDPALYIAKKMDNFELIGQSGMFTSYTGFYKGAKITVVSGGSGSPEAELLLYDYMEYSNASTYIRVGGSGGLGDDVLPGDIVISSGVVREEGMTQAYVPAPYPAVASYEVVIALVKAAEENGARFHVGNTLSVDSDFVGGGRPGVGGYMQPWNVDIGQIYNRAGVLNGDRESAAIVTLANLFGYRGGSICSVSDNLATGEKFTEGIGHGDAITIALEACAILNKMDNNKKQRNINNWFPETIGG